MAPLQRLHRQARREIDESKRQVIPLDPSEVLTVEMSAELLDPLIAPLPARPF